MTKPLKNVGASVRARLLELAKQRGDDFQLVLLRYVNERFLYRYGGIRVTLTAHVAAAKVRVQVDVGFGDAITPDAVARQYGIVGVNVYARKP